MDDFMLISGEIYIPYIMGTHYIYSQKFELTHQVTYHLRSLCRIRHYNTIFFLQISLLSGAGEQK